jgi:phage gp37-like protein
MALAGYDEMKEVVMKNLFEAARVEEVKQRIASLRPESERQWGKMNAAQAVAHCTAGFELALGERLPPRALMGLIIGGMVKPKVLGDDEPLRRNSPTVKGLVVNDDRNLETERERLCGMIDRFAATGPRGCTRHPHSFFGRLTPEEWATLMYKHLDHHLRQFGA